MKGDGFFVISVIKKRFINLKLERYINLGFFNKRLATMSLNLLPIFLLRIVGCVKKLRIFIKESSFHAENLPGNKNYAQSNKYPIPDEDNKRKHVRCVWTIVGFFCVVLVLPFLVRSKNNDTSPNKNDKISNKLRDAT